MPHALAAVTLAALVALPTPSVAQDAPSPATIPTLEIAMADLDWVGNPPVNPYWADDGVRVFFERERVDSPVRDTYVVDTRRGTITLVPDHERHLVDTRRGDLDSDRSHKIATRHGDLFLTDLATGVETQLTRTSTSESWPQFLLGDDRIAFRRGEDVFVRDLATGIEEQVVSFSSSDPRAGGDGGSSATPSFLEEQQTRLFEIVRERERRDEESRVRRETLESADPTRAPEPIRLGRGKRAGRFALSPRATHVLTSIVPESTPRGRADSMPAWVDASGYASSRSVRPLVGTSDRASASIAVVDLRTGALHEVDLSTLPEIRTDRLGPIREESTELAARWTPSGFTPAEDAATDGVAEESDDGEPPELPPRGVSVLDLRWSRDGRFASMMLRSVDNKDRWVAVLDVQNDGEEAYELRVVHHLHDPAWINWRFNEIGFLPDSRHLWFLSEETGTSHLYVADLIDQTPPRPLTSGPFEVSSVRVTRDGSTAYVIANREHPGVLELYAVPTDTDARVTPDALTRITSMGGHNQIFVSPDETRILIRHDSELRPPELYVQDLAPGASAVQLTDSTTPEFDAVAWTPPEHVEVPSTQADRPIHARLYLPPDGADRTRGADGRRAAVIFTHGAGYLQNAHKGWSDYVHEFMFHSVLARAGYVVLDPDYRASAGYGRAWRTAIARHMGEAEIVDLRDCVDYLVAEHGVDRERVGTYGGSYGGFLALISLFRAPDLFACGAALRPVTDWAHYNDWYTANILNTPDDDPLAYLRSSPIEYAEGLSAPLLMCHGMLDDNVFFKDTVRLAQRLIELGKTDWDVALYPIEGHGFREASSWLDEYRRIFALFEEHLLPTPGSGRTAGPH